MARVFCIPQPWNGAGVVQYLDSPPSNTLYNLYLPELANNAASRSKLDLIAAIHFRVKQWDITASYSAHRHVVDGTSIEDTTSAGSLEYRAVNTIRHPGTGVQVAPFSLAFTEWLFAAGTRPSGFAWHNGILERYVVDETDSGSGGSYFISRSSELTGTYDYVHPIDGPIHEDLSYADETIDGVLYPYADLRVDVSATIYLVPTTAGNADAYVNLTVSLNAHAVASPTHLYTDNPEFATSTLGSLTGKTYVGDATFNVLRYGNHDPVSTPDSTPFSVPLYASDVYDAASADIDFDIARELDAVIPFGYPLLGPKDKYTTENKVWSISGRLNRNPYEAQINHV